MRNLVEHPVTTGEALSYIEGIRSGIEKDLNSQMKETPEDLRLGDMRLVYLGKAIEGLKRIISVDSE